MKKAVKEIIAFSLVAISLALVVVAAVFYGVIGIIGTLIFILGVMFLSNEVDNCLRRKKELNELDFEKTLKKKMKSFSLSLKMAKQIDATAAWGLETYFSNQCKVAMELPRNWEQTISFREELRVAEANNVAKFEEDFVAYAEKVAQIVGLHGIQAGSIVNQLDAGDEILAEFKQYILELSLRTVL